MKQMILRAKNKFLTNKHYQKLAMSMLVFSMSLANPAYAAIDVAGGITAMVKYVSMIVSGVGIIYAVIAIFKWVSAIKQDDSERASQQIINVFIAMLLIAIGPITAVLLRAFGATNTYGLS